MSSVNLIAEEKGAYPDCGEKDGDGAKNSWGWCHAQSLPPDIHHIDGYIQREENTVLILWLLGLVCHGQNARKLGRKVWKILNPYRDVRPSL